MPNFVTRITEGITNGSATVLHYVFNLLLPHISLENFANKIEAAGDAAGNLANYIETSSSSALATLGNPVVIGVGGLVITLSVEAIVYCGYKLWEY